MVEPRCFLLGPTKKFSPQNGKKIEEKNWTSFFGQKFSCATKQRRQAHVQLHMGLSTLLCFIFFFCFSLLLDVDLGIFFPIPPKNFLPKMERKLKKKIGHHFWTKIPMCNCTWPCLRCSSSFFYLLSFSFSFLLDIASFFSFFFCFLLCFFLFFVFCFFVFFVFFMWFCFLFRCEFFFSRHDFYFF